MAEMVNIAEKLLQIREYWHPHVVGGLNGQHVKLAKIKGEFVWHRHDNEDELFMVIKGSLKIELRDKTLLINEGEFAIIPKGVEHRPTSDEEVHILLFEPATTLNTGNVNNDLTRTELKHI